MPEDIVLGPGEMQVIENPDAVTPKTTTQLLQEKVNMGFEAVHIHSHEVEGKGTLLTVILWREDE